MKITDITLNDTEGMQTINARDLHEFLEVGRDFTNWIKGRIEKYGFIEDQDYVIVFAKSGENKSEDGRGRPSTDYHISVSMAKELSMVENNQKGKQARRYFIHIEEQYKETAEVKKKIDSENMVLEAIEYLQNNVKALEGKVKRQQHKVDAYDDFMSANNCMDMTTVAKSLGIGRNKLFRLLRERGIFYRIGSDNHVKQEHLDNKRFDQITKPVVISGKVENKPVILVYPKGVEYIRTKILNNTSELAEVIS